MSETRPLDLGHGAIDLGIRVESLTKHFRRRNGEVVAAVDDVTLEVPRGEFWVLLGPSGCGKTTLLRSIAGLERPDRGRIELDGRTVYAGDKRLAVPIEQRGIGMVFQAYALWPHMNVRDNVAFPLTTGRRRRRPHRDEIDRRVRESLELVGIGELIDQPVGQLSGGQQQRVSLARAIVGGNDVVLFDEPLSNVDAKVREQLRVEIRALQRKLGFTALYVTHDQEEAMELADRIAVLSGGKVAQLGSVSDVYDSPKSRYVAEFIGVANVLDGRVTDDPAIVSTELGDVAVSPGDTPPRAGEAVVVVSRAHRWWASADAAGGGPNAWRGTVEAVAYVGSHVQLVVRVGSTLLKVWTEPGEAPVAPGAGIWIGVGPADCLVVADA